MTISLAGLGVAAHHLFLPNADQLVTANPRVLGIHLKSATFSAIDYLIEYYGFVDFVPFSANSSTRSNGGLHTIEHPVGTRVRLRKSWARSIANRPRSTRSLGLDRVASSSGRGGDAAAAAAGVQQQLAAIKVLDLEQTFVAPVRLDIEIVVSTHPNVRPPWPLDAGPMGCVFRTHYTISGGLEHENSALGTTDRPTSTNHPTDLVAEAPFTHRAHALSSLPRGLGDTDCLDQVEGAQDCVPRS
jgi:hypothetical protein